MDSTNRPNPPSPAVPPPTTPPTASPPPGEDRTVAIVGYLTLVGFIVALLIHNGKKTQLGAFHLRQMLGLIITGMALVVVKFVLIFIPILGWLVIIALWLSMLVFWVLGLISAINGQMKPVPLIGEYYQKWFANTFT
jgi:uncharacterized membrane protein